MDWFLYNNGLRHERVKENVKFAKYENFKYCNIFRELYICNDNDIQRGKIQKPFNARIC